MSPKVCHMQSLLLPTSVFLASPVIKSHLSSTFPGWHLPSGWSSHGHHLQRKWPSTPSSTSASSPMADYSAGNFKFPSLRRNRLDSCT